MPLRRHSEITSGRCYAPQINLEAYHTDLPGLLQKHVGKWVAYHNGRKHGPFESEFKALEACAEGDVPRNERLIRLIEPEPIGGHHVRRATNLYF